MKMQANKNGFLRNFCVAALVSLLAQCVWAAAKPVAVWEASDFAQAGTVTKSDLTLTLPTDATYSTADKSVQIKDTGLKIVVPSTITNPFGTGNSTTIQVLVKFSNFPVPTADNKGAVVAAFNDEYLGSCIIKGGISRGIWNGNTIYNTSTGWPNKGSESVVVTTSDTVQKYVMSYTRSSSTIEGLNVTYEGVGGYLDGQIAYGCGALKASPTISSIVIGGKTGTGSNFVVPTGMKVYGIALFTSSNTPSDLDSYVWPSEQTSRYEVTLNDGDTLALTPVMLENDVIAVTCNGSVSISGITSAAAFAKLDLMNVTGDKKYIFSDLSDSDYSALSAPIGGETYRFEGETALTTLPFLKKNTEDAYDFGGNVEIAKAVTISGQLAPYGNKGCYTIVEGGSISANYITLANKGGVTQNFVQNGGTVTATSSNPATATTAAMLLGHWGSTANYTVNGGTLSVVNAPIRLGWDGTGNLTVNGGTVTTAGFRGGSQNSHGGAGNLTLTSGKIILGASGIDLGTNGSVALNGGTLEATETSSITVAKTNGLSIGGSVVIEVAASKTLTVSSAIAGSGTIVKKGAGALTLPATTIAITLAEGTITSSSDALSVTLSDELLAAGKVLKKTTADSITTYSADDLMATKGDAKYASLENALADAAEGDEITLVKASAESIEIPANVTVATTSTAQFTGTVTGEGRIVFDGYLPADNSATAQSFTATTWTGTVVIKNYTTGNTYAVVGKYANATSNLTLDNVKCYIFTNGTTSYPNLSCNNLTIGEGGINPVGRFSGAKVKLGCNKLLGSGNILITTDQNNNPAYFCIIGNASEFSGTIDSDYSTAAQIVFATTEAQVNDLANGDFVARSVRVMEGATVSLGGTTSIGRLIGGVFVSGTLNTTGTISMNTNGIQGTLKLCSADASVTTMENSHIDSAIVTQRVVITDATEGRKTYSLETIQPEPPTPTEDGITPSIPGADTIEIVDAEGTTVTGGTIPLVTGVYTVTGKVGETVVATETLAVVKSKEAETTTTPVTTAVAVPFKGATVANLLNTALLNAGDELKAFVGGSYSAWTLAADTKTWTPVQKARDGADPEAGAPATTELKRGTAVWVTTAGKVVAFGAYDSTAEVSEVTKGYNLIGNPKMEPITLEAETVGDILIPVGGSARYTAIQKGEKIVWQCSESVQDGVIPGTTIPAFGEDVSEKNPTIQVGGGAWLIIK